MARPRVQALGRVRKSLSHEERVERERLGHRKEGSLRLYSELDLDAAYTILVPVLIMTVLQLWALLFTPHHPVTMIEDSAKLSAAVFELAGVAQKLKPIWPFPDNVYDDEAVFATQLARDVISAEVPCWLGWVGCIPGKDFYFFKTGAISSQTICYWDGTARLGTPGQMEHAVGVWGPQQRNLTLPRAVVNNTIDPKYYPTRSSCFAALGLGPISDARGYYEKVEAGVGSCVPDYPWEPLRNSSVFEYLTLEESNSWLRPISEVLNITSNLTDAIRILMRVARYNTGRDVRTDIFSDVISGSCWRPNVCMPEMTVVGGQYYGENRGTPCGDCAWKGNGYSAQNCNDDPKCISVDGTGWSFMCPKPCAKCETWASRLTYDSWKACQASKSELESLRGGIKKKIGDSPWTSWNKDNQIRSRIITINTPDLIVVDL